MSRFIVNLEDSSAPARPIKVTAKPPDVTPQKKKPGRFVKILGYLSLFVLILLIAGSVGAYFYWQNLKTSPQYSLALLVDAARRDDQKAIDELVDTDAVVESFIPQITGKAVELYGRGLPPAIIARVAQVAEPVKPAIKKRAREEMPRVIREKTDKFENFPFWSIAIGAGRFIDIREEGGQAFVKSKIPGREMELTMKRAGDKWQVIAIRDDRLAQKIAETVGQEIIAIASKGGVGKLGEKLGIRNLPDLMKQLDGVLK